MLEGLRQLFLPRPLLQVAIDLLDIFLVAYLVYRVLLVLRGTRAMQMGIGLLFVGGIYVVARFLGLVTLVTLLSTLLSSIILVVVVVFQNDLRRALMRAGRPLLGGLTRTDESKVIEEVVAAASELARLRYGAIITWERDANLEEFIVGAGTQLDAVVTRELLVSIFIPVGENKLHDGSVIIRNLRLAQAGVFFPMPEKLNLDKKFGSRHRAALGITADTDAVAVVVSEERGTIMFCFQENHVDNVTPETLRNLLRNYETKTKKKTIKTGAPASQRRSLPPPPTSMRTPP
ncbi:MAG: diadenylate cyclase CdaA, partial [Polyangiales bacterium]